MYSSSGLNRKLPSLMEDGTYEQVDAAPSIDNYFQEHVEVIRDADNKVTKKIYSLKIRPDVRKGLSKERIAELEELAVLTQRMAQEGQLGRSMMYDTVGLQPSGRKRSPYDFVTAGSAWMFHQIERMNRQVANVSVYQLELDRMKKEKLGLDKKATLTPKQRMETKLSNEQYDNAAEEAIYRAQEMNGGAFLATAPRHAQSGWGRVALMYKGYALRMHYTMLKTAWLGYKNARGGDKQKAKEALYQLVGIGGSTVLLAGVQGLPFFGLWTMIANLFLDDDDDDAETIVRKYIGEGWYKGPLTKYSGVDVSTRIGLSNMFLRQNPYAWDALPHERAAEVALGPAFSVYKQMERGYLQLADGEVKRGIETMVPSAFRNVFKVFRWGADDAVLSRRGDVILDDVSTADLVMQFVGFAPREYTLQQEKNVATKRIDKVTSKRRTMLLRRYYISRRMGDSSVSKETRNDIMEFNSKHPQWRISIKDMLKSMKAHRKSSREMVGGISLSPRMRSTLLASQNEYWGEDPFWDE